MPTAKDVARYFISLSEPSTPLAITPLKLQKLRSEERRVGKECIYGW